MKRALLFISWLLLVSVPYHAAMAAEASSFESQLLEARKTILSQAASTHEEFTPQAVISPVSGKESTPFIEMFVGWNHHSQFYITEQNLKLNVIGNRNWHNGVVVFTGDLEATAEPISPSDPSSGYHLKGVNVDVHIVRVGSMARGYFIIGTYKKFGRIKPIYLTIRPAPMDDGWDISANGRPLYVNEICGTSIGDCINQDNIGKPVVGVLGACLGAVNYFPQ